MNEEVEIKVKVFDPKEVEKKILQLGGGFIAENNQTDIYFIHPNRDYFKEKPITEYLRVRFEKGRHHLNYSRVHLDKEGNKLSTDEYETMVEKPEMAVATLKKIGLLEKLTVKKRRKYFKLENFELTLDEIKGLGNFLEIEAKKGFGGAEKTRKKCFEILKKLNIKYEESLKMSYPDMLLEKSPRE